MERRLYESIKYTFDATEIRDLGEELARLSQTVIDLRDQKAAMAAALAAQLKGAGKRVAELAGKINNGYELREVECQFMMDEPRTGLKTLIRRDTSKPVRAEAMSLEEQQTGFRFEGGEGQA